MRQDSKPQPLPDNEQKPAKIVREPKRAGRIIFGCQSDEKIPLINNIALAFLDDANERLHRPETIELLGHRASTFAEAINSARLFPFHAQCVNGVIQLSFAPAEEDCLPVLKDIGSGLTLVTKKFIGMLDAQGANDLESIKVPLALLFQPSIYAAYMEAGLESGPQQKGRGSC